MKLIEKILISIFILSILLKAFNISFSSTFFIISLSLLCLHYFPFGTYSLINLKLQKHLIIYTLSYGFSISLGLGSILYNIIFPQKISTFNVNHLLFIVSLILLALSILSAFFMYKKCLTRNSTDSNFFYYFIYRCLVLIVLIVLAYLPSAKAS